MDFFKVDALADWHKVEPGESLLFPADGARRVRVSVSTNAPVEVWAGEMAEGAQEILCATRSGQFNVEFTAEGESFLRFLAPADAAIYVRGWAPDHRVPASGDASYTKIAPRQRRNSDLDRMMMLLRYNEMQREARYQADLERLRAEMAAQAAPASVDEPVVEGGAGAA